MSVVELWQDSVGDLFLRLKGHDVAHNVTEGRGGSGMFTADACNYADYLLGGGIDPVLSLWFEKLPVADATGWDSAGPERIAKAAYFDTARRLSAVQIALSDTVSQAAWLYTAPAPAASYEAFREEVAEVLTKRHSIGGTTK